MSRRPNAAIKRRGSAQVVTTKVFNTDITKLRGYLRNQHKDLTEFMDQQRLRERKAMERGMRYFINT